MTRPTPSCRRPQQRGRRHRVDRRSPGSSRPRSAATHPAAGRGRSRRRCLGIGTVQRLADAVVGGSRERPAVAQPRYGAPQRLARGDPERVVIEPGFSLAAWFGVGVLVQDEQRCLGDAKRCSRPVSVLDAEPDDVAVEFDHRRPIGDGECGPPEASVVRQRRRSAHTHPTGASSVSGSFGRRTPREPVGVSLLHIAFRVGLVDEAKVRPQRDARTPHRSHADARRPEAESRVRPVVVQRPGSVLLNDAGAVPVVPKRPPSPIRYRNMQFIGVGRAYFIRYDGPATVAAV